MEAATEAHVRRGRFVVWLVPPATLLVLSGYFIYGASIYETLPESVPTHWGASGEPDAWSEKSFGSVFALLIVALGLTVLMAFASAVVPVMSPPRKEPTAWELYRREGMIRGTIAGLGLTSLCLSLLCGMLSVAGWNSPEHLSAWPVLLFVVLILAVLVACYACTARWSRAKAAEQGTAPTEEEAAEDKLWTAGVLYNNPEDPRVLVSKREGTGYGVTVNVGNPKGRTAVFVFLVLVIGLPLLLVSIPAVQG